MFLNLTQSRLMYFFQNTFNESLSEHLSEFSKLPTTQAGYLVQDAITLRET